MSDKEFDELFERTTRFIGAFTMLALQRWPSGPVCWGKVPGGLAFRVNGLVRFTSDTLVAQSLVAPEQLAIQEFDSMLAGG